MTLPPLPLIDGALFIDNSGWVEGMSTCNRYLQYKSLNLRIQGAEKPSLNFGSAIHLALEHRYRKYRNGFVNDQYYNEVASLFTTFFAEHEPPADDWRTMNWAMSTVRRYNEKYDIEQFELLTSDKGEVMVELSFALPLFVWKGKLPVGCGVGVKDYLSVMAECTEEEVTQLKEYRCEVPIIYTGRIDLPISLDGQIFVMDHKTTSMLGSTFFERMKMSSQQKGYCWAYEQLTGQKVAGYVVNAIRTKEPPLYVTSGKPSPRSGARPQTPEAWWNESLQRERYILKDGELDEWKHNTIALVEEFFFNYQRGEMPMKTAWCTQYGRCPYFDVCSLPESDRGVMLASGLYANNEWSPLKQPTQPKQ